MKSLLLATTVLALGVGTAAAQDATYDWSGAYVGAQVGYGWGKSKVRIDVTPPFYFASEYDPDGFLGGLYAGYNFQLRNNLVLGIDADLNVANLNDRSSDWVLSNGIDSVPFPAFIGDIREKWAGSVRVRAGYAFERFLPYIAGGISFGEHQLEIDTPDGYNLVSQSLTSTGWNIGVGLEYAATDKITIRGEYRFTDFGSRTGNGVNTDDTTPVSWQMSSNDLRFGIAYKF